MDVTLVGSGNVAFVLGKLLISAGHSIKEVFGRNTETLNSISRLTGAKIKRNFSDVDKKTGICIIAVSDSSIAGVAEQIEAGDKLVVHTSGAVSKEALSRFANYGVLYPLQSLRKEMDIIPPIPFFIDANFEENILLLQQAAASTGNVVSRAGDDERLRYHIAAVLSSNFTNHLYAVTQRFCEAENISFANLLPLINETAQRLHYFPAEQMQTGPAVRNDENTIQLHLQALKPYPDIESLYRLLSKSIQPFSKS